MIPITIPSGSPYLRAPYNIGDRNPISDEAKESFRLAFSWFEKAAAQGDAMALYFLGRCCEEGTGTEQNRALAFTFYLRSAELENIWAQTAVGRCCEEGIGTQKDHARAAEFYRRAAESGDAEARDALDRLDVE